MAVVVLVVRTFDYDCVCAHLAHEFSIDFICKHMSSRVYQKYVRNGRTCTILWLENPNIAAEAYQCDCSFGKCGVFNWTLAIRHIK